MGQPLTPDQPVQDIAAALPNGLSKLVIFIVCLVLIYSGVYTGRNSRIANENINMHIWAAPEFIQIVDGVSAGPVIDRLNALHSVMDVHPKVNIIAYNTYAEFVTGMLSDPTGAIVSINGIRSDKYTWIGPIYDSRLSFYAIASDSPVLATSSNTEPTYSNSNVLASTSLENKTIGILWCGQAGLEIFSMLNTVTIKKYPDGISLFKALDAGDVDIILYADIGIPISSKYARVCSFQGAGVYIGFLEGTGEYILSSYTSALLKIRTTNINNKGNLP